MDQKQIYWCYIQAFKFLADRLLPCPSVLSLIAQYTTVTRHCTQASQVSFIYCKLLKIRNLFLELGKEKLKKGRNLIKSNNGGILLPDRKTK